MTDLEATAWDAMVGVLELAAADIAFRRRYGLTIQIALDAIDRSEGDLPCDRCDEYFPPDMLRVEGGELISGESGFVCQKCFPHDVDTPHGPAGWDDLPRVEAPSQIVEKRKNQEMEADHG